MKLQEWAKRDDLQLEWKRLWESNDVLKQGLEVLKEVALPAEVKIPNGMDAIDFNALINAKREGYFDFVRNIEILKEMAKPSEALPGPWEENNQKGN